MGLFGFAIYEELRTLGQHPADGVGPEGEVVLFERRNVNHTAASQVDHVVEGVEAG